MHIIVCLDDKNGMLFHNRRQSSDSMLRAHLMRSLEGKRLWMNAYSAKQFDAYAAKCSVAEDFLERAGAGEYCFVENEDLSPYIQKIERVFVYRWNRTYPADLRFPEVLLSRRTLAYTEDFSGNSHEKLTREVYVL